MSHFSVLYSRYLPFSYHLVSPSPTQDVFALLPLSSTPELGTPPPPYNHSLVFQRLDGDRFLSIPLSKLTRRLISDISEHFVWRPDGRAFALVRDGIKIEIYDFETHKCVFTINDHHVPGRDVWIRSLAWVRGPSRERLDQLAQHAANQTKHSGAPPLRSYPLIDRLHTRNPHPSLADLEAFDSSAPNSAGSECHSNPPKRSILTDGAQMADWNYLLVGDSSGRVSVWHYGTHKWIDLQWKSGANAAMIDDIQLDIESGELVIVSSSLSSSPSSAPIPPGSIPRNYQMDRISLSPLRQRIHELDFYSLQCQQIRHSLDFLTATLKSAQKCIASIRRSLALKFDPLPDVYNDEFQIPKPNFESIHNDFKLLLATGNPSEPLKSFFTRYLNPIPLGKAYQSIESQFQRVKQLIQRYTIPTIMEIQSRLHHLLSLSRISHNTSIGYSTSILTQFHSSIDLLLLKCHQYYRMIRLLHPLYTSFFVWMIHQSNEITPEKEVETFYGTHFPRPPFRYREIMEFIQWEFLSETNSLDFLFQGNEPMQVQGLEGCNGNVEEMKSQLAAWKELDGQFNESRLMPGKCATDSEDIQEILAALRLPWKANDQPAQDRVQRIMSGLQNQKDSQTVAQSSEWLQPQNVETAHFCSLSACFRLVLASFHSVLAAPSQAISAAINASASSSAALSPFAVHSFSSYFKSASASSSRHPTPFPIGSLTSAPFATRDSQLALHHSHSATTNSIQLAFASNCTGRLHLLEFHSPVSNPNSSSSLSDFSSIDLFVWSYPDGYSSVTDLQFYRDGDQLFIAALFNWNMDRKDPADFDRCRFYLIDFEQFRSSAVPWSNSAGAASFLESVKGAECSPIPLSTGLSQSGVCSREFPSRGRFVSFSLTRGLAALSFQTTTALRRSDKTSRKLAIIDLREHEELDGAEAAEEMTD